MPFLNKDYSSSVVNVFTVVISKSCLSASFTSVFKKKITSIPLFIASFPIFTAIGAFIKNKTKKKQQTLK